MDVLGASPPEKLKIHFLPFQIAPGHMIPFVDMARLFARHGVDVTILITHYNSLLFQPLIQQDIQSGLQISFHILTFPASEVGIPVGIENINTITSPEMAGKLFYGISLLRPQIETFFKQQTPHCIISDMFYPWTSDFALEHGIPRIYCDPTAVFPQCAADALERFSPQDGVESETEMFLIPNLPDRIQISRSQIPSYLKGDGKTVEIMKQIRYSRHKSFGFVMNSFYELEAAYVEHFRKNVNSRTWPIGPAALSFQSNNTSSITFSGEAKSGNDCVSWLNTKEPNSVVYVCFGSMFQFEPNQLAEIAVGLESSGHSFVWVIKKKEEEWLPKGFEQRVMDKGLIIRGWAPQVGILNHPATGGFVTHCGWNSISESVGAGVPLITWPIYAEQFYNDKLLTEVLKIGVSVGVKRWSTIGGNAPDLIKGEQLERAVKQLMGGGDEAKQLRKRTQEYAVMAKQAIGIGGSSYNNVNSLIDEIKLYHKLGMEMQR